MTDHNDELDESPDVVEKGMADLPRDSRGNVDLDALTAYVAERIDFDEKAERFKKARRKISDKRKPGAGHPDGQLNFDGVDPYDYEPDRLVLGDLDQTTGRTPIVENHRALADIKQAESRRKMKKATEMLRQAERAQAEASGHSDWTAEQMEDGEKRSDLPFGRFVRDAGVHIEDQP